jgi:hypothetical protein
MEKSNKSNSLINTLTGNSKFQCFLKSHLSLQFFQGPMLANFQAWGINPSNPHSKEKNLNVEFVE